MKKCVFQKNIFQKTYFFSVSYRNRSVAFASTHPGLVRTKGDQVGSKGTKQTSMLLVGGGGGARILPLASRVKTAPKSIFDEFDHCLLEMCKSIHFSGLPGR